MGQSVFATSQVHAGSFRADQLQINFGGESIRGLLVQDIQFNFQQQLSMLYELGSANVYYVGGRAQGTASISQIIGPASRAPVLLSKFRDLCTPQDIAFDASAGCQGALGGLAHTLKSAVLVGLSVGATSQNVVITRSLNFMYIDLQIDQGPSATDTSGSSISPTAAQDAVPSDSGGGTTVNADGTVSPTVTTSQLDNGGAGTGTGGLSDAAILQTVIAAGQ